VHIVTKQVWGNNVHAELHREMCIQILNDSVITFHRLDLQNLQWLSGIMGYHSEKTLKDKLK